MTPDSDFTSIPILDLCTLRTNREQLLSELQGALINVGFFYVKGHGINPKLLEELSSQTVKFFDLPLDEKLKVDKIHSPTFLGYSSQGNEITKGSKDNREQFDFANELPDAWTSNRPIYERLSGPNLWPTENLAPDFTSTILSFHQEAQKLAEQLTRLVSECLGLHPNALANEYLVSGQQNRAKLIKYPSVDQLHLEDGTQGVGAHRDTGSLLTILYQANDLPGLQVQNHSGDWIDAPPIPNTFVVNIGTGLAYLVHNVVAATTHRVLNPPPGRGPRYSVPYFLSARMDKKLKPVEGIPKEILAKRPDNVITDSGHQFSHLYADDPGTYYLLNRISSHRDVGAKFYPELAAKYGIELGANTGY
ncbi:hypothetical protein H4R20_000536 [Coemansia guatemalensis]|uniref:Fe2OG dioxygenase domain-containing protein n=1 Tax=Coemansia guatemalensis TaxID=2761395 RepID=A0A9W8HYZ9_9FUNG|nr:hypothetical protein H4R20_000536 [Coemansia guatemalensis]